MQPGLAVLVVVLVAATGFGLYRRATDGRIRGARPLRASAADAVGAAHGDGPLLRADDIGSALGERATLVQFSTSFCAPCRTTRVVLREVAGLVPGVTHVEVDAEAHLGLVRRLGIARTPTVLVLDATGREVRRAVGAPRRDEVLATLDAVLA